jgi:hypothetical protein
MEKKNQPKTNCSQKKHKTHNNCLLTKKLKKVQIIVHYFHGNIIHKDEHHLKNCFGHSPNFT